MYAIAIYHFIPTKAILHQSRSFISTLKSEVLVLSLSRSHSKRLYELHPCSSVEKTYQCRDRATSKASISCLILNLLHQNEHIIQLSNSTVEHEQSLSFSRPFFTHLIDCTGTKSFIRLQNLFFVYIDTFSPRQCTSNINNFMLTARDTSAL